MAVFFADDALLASVVLLALGLALYWDTAGKIYETRRAAIICQGPALLSFGMAAWISYAVYIADTGYSLTSIALMMASLIGMVTLFGRIGAAGNAGVDEVCEEVA